ncbi:DEAD/DEAH box helicase family protein [Nocardioides cavernae]|uniref:DEAD/DEAH box helicase family protein n=1 Tax=Nocardioides cavernae TaxID=1921566 RepID=A0ABR8ND79_9ACTN|nr:DEAD/DEAH box helicase family protein [Nocardioides cavernae]MBD3926090.1 DEAD/DEAH box helicase family protein [Nocardioides cavernae]MBM7513679.1 hypothetical protein [Nocardioides cavernae]
MRFELHPYQRDAVEKVLDNLERARVAFHRDGESSSLSLTATTGAGKTVMAAAAIEALFYGSSDLLDGFEPDPGAVVVWFSDDPALNLQTRDRLIQASEQLNVADLVVIEPPFSRKKLEPGKVYFLNTGKLGKNSLLTRGHVADADVEQTAAFAVAPDLQSSTIWETISNTIEDEDLTVYLILDEAHRGFTPAKVQDKPTLVRRLINGHAGYKPIPIVWGISATIERFDDAMKTADASKNRRALQRVLVDPGLVQASGLVKDTIALTIPDEAGQFDLTFVRHAAERLKASADRWAGYAKQQEEADVVVPLLILQVRNTPDDEAGETTWRDEIGQALDVIAAVLGDVDARHVRHVLSGHKPQKFGPWEIDWIPPQRVEGTREVRVLVAKDAISTGWDCPRAEVMVSFRPAKDSTHITQLLGRMVRSPLARRVPGDERLNAVDCILPFFDRTTAGNVVKYLTGQIEEMPGSAQRKVLLEPCELTRNPAIPQAVWDVWDRLPTQTMPQRGARPVIRLTALAQALSHDGIRPRALEAVNGELIPVLDKLAADHADALEAAVSEIWDVHVKEILGRTGGSRLTYNDFVIRADDRAIRTGFRFATKALGHSLATAYVDHLCPEDDDDDELRDAFVRTAALASTRDVRARVDEVANSIAERWFDEFRRETAKLSDERQEEYEKIRGLAVDPQRGWLGEPRLRMEDYKVVDKATGEVSEAPLLEGHLMADANGLYPLGGLNPWEVDVVRTEMSRDGALGWYRNPPRPATDSLTIAYRDDAGNWRSMHPDFVFFHDIDGEVKASIVDPHSHHLDDARMKLNALADYAERYGDSFDRIEQVTVIGNRKRTIPLHFEYSREGIRKLGRSVVEYYESDIAIAYEA